MAEAEDVIVDVARHATSYAQELLRRRRTTQQPPKLCLLDIAPRLGILLTALHEGHYWQLRVAQPPAPVTFLDRIFRRWERPWRQFAVPSGEANVLWLPRELDDLSHDHDAALSLYRVIALQQAYRAIHRNISLLNNLNCPLQRDIYLAIEAKAADAALAHMLPGLDAPLARLRSEALYRRPVLHHFHHERHDLERWYREILSSPLSCKALQPEQLVEKAQAIAEPWRIKLANASLYKDWWIGDWSPKDHISSHVNESTVPPQSDDQPVRSAKLSRRPIVRPSGG